MEWTEKPSLTLQSRQDILCCYVYNAGVALLDRHGSDLAHALNATVPHADA